MMVRLLAVLLCLAGPAGATQDVWPALFDVTGVASDDVLNVRAAPDASAEIVGTLAHDATGIEVILPNDRETWGMVNMGEAPGWVSLSYLQRRPGQWLGAFPEVRTCSGTEPFWTLRRSDDGALRWLTPVAEEMTGVEDATLASLSRRDRYAFTGELGGAPLTATLGLESCSDGMSDQAFGITIDLILRGEDGPTLYSGCCSLAP